MTFKTSTDVAVWDASVFEWSVYHGEMLAGGVYLGADADVARTRAVAACKDFLTFWKDADPDHPIYRQAKAEYAKLQCSPRTARKNGQLPISSGYRKGLIVLDLITRLIGTWVAPFGSV